MPRTIPHDRRAPAAHFPSRSLAVGAVPPLPLSPPLLPLSLRVILQTIEYHYGKHHAACEFFSGVSAFVLSIHTQTTSKYFIFEVGSPSLGLPAHSA